MDGRVWKGFSGSGHGKVVGSCEYYNETSGSVICGRFLIGFSRRTLFHAVTLLTTD